MDFAELLRWLSASEGVTTGLFTLAGSLGGVWLTQSHVARIARGQRRDAHQAVLRGILTRLITTGRAWAYVVEPLARQLAECDDKEVSETLAAMWQTAEWAEADRLSHELLDAFTAAELHLGDRNITDSVVNARLWIGIVDSALRDRRAPTGTVPSRSATDRHGLQELVDSFRYWLHQTEDEARLVLRMTTATIPRRVQYAVRGLIARGRGVTSALHRAVNRSARSFYVDPLSRYPKPWS